MERLGFCKSCNTHTTDLDKKGLCPACAVGCFVEAEKPLKAKTGADLRKSEK